MTEQPGPPTEPTPPPAPPPAPPPGAAVATGTAAPLIPGAGPPQPPYPAQLDIAYQEEYNRWLPLVKGLLAIPHFFALFFVLIAAYLGIIGAWFAVLFTGKYPPGIFNFVVGAYRWLARVNAYTRLQTDLYPPFSLDDDPNYPVRVVVQYPEQGIARWRPLLSWLLVIPYAICAYFVILIAGVCVVIAFFTILFTKKFPRELFDVVTISERWALRTFVYAEFMTEEYPPFVWA
jgi:hypothetical protein